MISSSDFGALPPFSATFQPFNPPHRLSKPPQAGQECSYLDSCVISINKKRKNVFTAWRKLCNLRQQLGSSPHLSTNTPSVTQANPHSFQIGEASALQYLPNLAGIVVQLQPPPDMVTLQPRSISTQRLYTTGSIIACYMYALMCIYTN